MKYRRRKRNFQIRHITKTDIIIILTIIICILSTVVLMQHLDAKQKQKEETPIITEYQEVPYDNSLFKQDGEFMTYADDTYISKVGIDVSSHQEEIDWKKVKEAGIEFAYIRCGYRGYSTGDIHKDEYFEQNIQGALDNGIEVGIYFFSQAMTVDEAREEANFTIDCMKPYHITLPVVYDFEEPSEDCRVIGLTSSERTTNAATFLHIIKDHGYDPMIYNSSHLFAKLFDTRYLQEFKTWVAEYDTAYTDYTHMYQIWQYTSTGSVDGIDGNTDMNIMLIENNH